MTESTPPTPQGDAATDDVAARVLAAAKTLRDGFDERFSAIATKVKKQSEGPVKIIEMDDEVPVVMQLSIWDPKVGPVPAMLVGEARLLGTITAQEQEDTTRMMDVLAAGATCDLSKGGVNRILLKCAIADPRARGGETWLLVAAYYDPTIGVPKEVVEELLKELAASLRPETPMATEAMAIREVYNPATSKWRELLQEMRQSIWALVQKAGEVALPILPGMEVASGQAETPEAFPAKDDGHVKRKKRAKPSPDAVKATIFSKLARATLDAATRAKEAIDARAQARKAIDVPPVGEVVPFPAPALPPVPAIVKAPAETPAPAASEA